MSPGWLLLTEARARARSHPHRECPPRPTTPPVPARRQPPRMVRLLARTRGSTLLALPHLSCSRPVVGAPPLCGHSGSPHAAVDSPPSAGRPAADAHCQDVSPVSGVPQRRTPAAPLAGGLGWQTTPCSELAYPPRGKRATASSSAVVCRPAAAPRTEGARWLLTRALGGGDAAPSRPPVAPPRTATRAAPAAAGARRHGAAPDAAQRGHGQGGGASNPPPSEAAAPNGCHGRGGGVCTQTTATCHQYHRGRAPPQGQCL